MRRLGRKTGFSERCFCQIGRGMRGPEEVSGEGFGWRSEEKFCRIGEKSYFCTFETLTLTQ